VQQRPTSGLCKEHTETCRLAVQGVGKRARPWLVTTTSTTDAVRVLISARLSSTGTYLPAASHTAFKLKRRVRISPYYANVAFTSRVTYTRTLHSALSTSVVEPLFWKRLLRDRRYGQFLPKGINTYTRVLYYCIVTLYCAAKVRVKLSLSSIH
jgi:hypothetical protein